MENASKALMIGASMLIALLIIGVLVFMFTNYSTVFKSQEGIKETEQLTEFNNKYEIYNKKLLRGTDVISVINQAIDNNEKYKNEQEYQINIEFKMKQALSYKKIIEKNKTKVETREEVFNTKDKYDITSFQNIKNDSDAFIDFKRRVFNCEKIGYSKITGRVNYMYFEEVLLTDNAYINSL